MKKFISVKEWRDNTDGHIYREGEPFPFDGREIPEKRLSELESGHNRAGLVLIRALDVQDDPVEVQNEEVPETASEGSETAAAKKPRKSRAKK